MSAILDAANDIILDRYPNTVSAVSIGGYAKREQSSPIFYYVSCSLPPMYEEDYRKIQTELISIRDGVDFLMSNIPNKHNLFLGSWAGTPVISEVSGKNITFTGFTPDAMGVALPGDFIQFSNSTKVYQVANVVDADDTGMGVLTLNTDVITAPTPGETTVNRGEECVYKLLLEEKPSVNAFPGAGAPIYQFSGAFVFREVL